MNHTSSQTKSFRKPLLFLFAFFLTLVLSISVSLAEEKVIKFGCAISMSGVFAHEGKLQKDGLDLWVETVNRTGGINVGKEKYKVEVVYYDDKSDTMTSTKLVEKLITDDKIKFIFGPFGSGATFATGAIAEKYKVIMIAPMGSSPEIYERGYKYLFGVVRTMDLSYENEAEFLSQLEPRPKTLAIIAQNSLWPLSSANFAKSYSEKRGLKVLFSDKFPPGTEDFSSLLIEIKQHKPDVFLGISFTKEEILMAKQLRELKVDVPMVIMPGGPSTVDFLKALGDTAEYIVYDTAWTPSLPYSGKMFGTSKDYFRIMKEKYGYEVDRTGACGTEAGLIFQLAIEKANSLDTEKVREAIKGLNETTFYGPIKFDDRGINVGTPVTMMQIQQGKRVAVWPSAHADGKLKYPTPKWEAR